MAFSDKDILMDEQSKLRPATVEECLEGIAFGLRFHGRKRMHDADAAMARIAAERILQSLQQSGFVLMKQPDRAAPSTAHHVKS